MLRNSLCAAFVMVALAGCANMADPTTTIVSRLVREAMSQISPITAAGMRSSTQSSLIGVAVCRKYAAATNRTTNPTRAAAYVAGTRRDPLEP